MRKYIKAFSMLVTALLMLSMLAVFPVKAHAGWADIYVEPAVKHLTKPPYDVGQTFKVEVRIKNYTQVAGYQVKLVYDNSLLNVSSPNDVVYDPDDHIFPSGTYSPVATSVGVFNLTHQYIMKTATTFGAVEYSGDDAGLVEITFHIMSVPPKGSTYSCLLWVEPKDGGPGSPYPGDTYTYSMDENLEDNAGTLTDGLYEIEGIMPKPYLAMDPVSITKPDIPGDRIIGDTFTWDIMAKDFDQELDIILAEFAVSYDPDYLLVIDVIEGTFMNDTEWAPYGTQLGWAIDPGLVSGFILINPNSTPPHAGEWNWPERPHGEGLFCTLVFEVVWQPFEPEDPDFPIDIHGVFGEFFLNTSIEYVPYGDPINGTLTFNGMYWDYPIADFTWSPPTPLPLDIVTFDASSSMGYRNDDGVLTLDPAVIVLYEWDWGDGSDPESTTDPTITHSFEVMGPYLVTLKVTDYNKKQDTESKTIWVVFGRVIDVHTQYEDPFGGQGQDQPSDMFWPQKPVILTAILTYNGKPVQTKPVAFQIVSPTGYWNFTRVVMSDENGTAVLYFGLPWPCEYPEDAVFGIWTVVAKADIQCTPVEDWLWFKVYWYTHDLTVTVKGSEYESCEDVEFTVTFESCSSQPRQVLITAVLFDDLDVPVGQASMWVTVGDRQLQWCKNITHTYDMSIHLPKYAFVGQGKVYVNTFFNWPWDCGYALAPEAKDTFSIIYTPP